MLDFLVGTSALGKALIDLEALRLANKGIKPKDIEKKDAEILHPVSNDIPDNRSNRMKKQKEAYMQWHNNLPKDDKIAMEKDALSEWIFTNADLLASLFATPGHKLIPNENLSQVNVEKLADFLFLQESIEQVEITADGIEMLLR